MTFVDPFLIALGTPSSGAAPSPWLQLIPFVLILGIFYFVMILPMRKRQQKVQEFQGALKVGDKVITSGGIFGIDHAGQRSVGPAPGRQQRAHRSLASGDRRIPGPGTSRP